MRDERLHLRDRAEQIGAWLTAAQNELLALRIADDAQAGARRADPGALDGSAGCRMLEIVAAVFLIEWG